MNTQHPISYGVYIDQSQSFIITLFQANEQQPVIESITETPEEEQAFYPFRNKGKEYVQKLCRSIVNRLGHAQSMLIFGPAEAKYELRNELQQSGSVLLRQKEHLVTTDAMSVEEALRFSRVHMSKLTDALTA